ncbi:MAG: protein-L-isoaspartate O-methyltransferase [Candidatus Paceibacteria bacterium]
MHKEQLVRSLKNQSFSDKIVESFDRVDRKDFVPDEQKPKSYEDTALPIGHGQTISQPYTIAFMLNLLGPQDGQNILEVGSGSGYVLALMDEMTENASLYGVEIVSELAARSKKDLEDIDNVEVFAGQGRKGLKDKGPFDRILVSASAEKTPQELINQLKMNGILVAPVGNSIVRVQKTPSENKMDEYSGFSFVPLVGEE